MPPTTTTVTGAPTTTTVTQPPVTSTTTQTVYAQVPKAGYIEWNADECAACSRCVTACAAYKHGAVALQLSSIKWIDKQEFYGFEPRMPLFCQQCSEPECYFACPLKDYAFFIDEKTGVRYIDTEKCNGCGICVTACPFEESRINLAKVNGRTVAIKCDLCKDRPEGPVCVEVCDRQALTFVSSAGRL